MSAYFLFQNDVREDIKKKNPDLSIGDMAKLISAKYKDLSEKDKKAYDKKYE